MAGRGSTNLLAEPGVGDCEGEERHGDPGENKVAHHGRHVGKQQDGWVHADSIAAVAGFT